MIQTARRGFLKLGAAVVGSLAIMRYAEPIIQLTKHHEWIEDRGDFVIVRIPDFKSFANEQINKPVVFLMGEQSTIRNIDVKGFANIYAPRGGSFTDSSFDSRHIVTESNRSAIELRGQGMIIGGIKMQFTPSSNAPAIFVS